jgi:nucleoside-diphosphate kinase
VKEERYVFKTEWFDKQAELLRPYLFTFFPKDCSAEMYDLKQRRMFMKRMAVTGVTVKELYLGAIITVFSRQLRLVDYGDIFTKNKFESKAGRTFAMVKPDCYTQTGKIIDAIYQNGFTISRLKMSRFCKPQQADEFYEQHRGKPFFADLNGYMQSDVCTGMELVAEDAVTRFRDLIGPTNSQEAKQTAPHTLRACFGSDSMRNAVHGSASSTDYQKECSLFFSKSFEPTAVFNNCTCCIIKPHIVQEGLAG